MSQLVPVQIKSDAGEVLFETALPAHIAEDAGALDFLARRLERALGDYFAAEVSAPSAPVPKTT